MTALHPEARARFVAFTERYEGRIDFLYADIKGLVTIGAGCLVDPVSLALSLRLRWPDGGLASADQIRDEWMRIKTTPGLAQKGAGAASKVAKLRLSPADLDALTLARLDATVTALVRRWPAFASWPWRAQLAVCSWAWAVGAAAKFPKFEAALLAGDWAAAAEECTIREEGNPGVAPRNRANRELLLQAAAEVEAPPDTDRATPPPEGVPGAQEAYGLAASAVIEPEAPPSGRGRLDDEPLLIRRRRAILCTCTAGQAPRPDTLAGNRGRPEGTALYDHEPPTPRPPPEGEPGAFNF